jgi:hypothetical protein
MKFLTVVYTLICFFSTIQTARAIYLSYLFGFRARTRSITYMLAIDKVLYERLMRWSLWALLAANFILLTHMVNRLVLKFPPWVSGFSLASTFFLMLAMALISNVALVSYDDKMLTWLIKLLKKNNRTQENP